MKIAFFTDDYLPYVHGVTTSIQNYRRALEELGHEVFVIAPNVSDYEETDDHVIRMPSVNSYIFEKRSISIIYPGLARKFDEYEFDVVHTHTQFWLGALGYMVAKRQNIPHISSMHTIFAELIDDYPLAVMSGMFAVSIGYPIAFKTRPIIAFDPDMLSTLRKNDRAFFKAQAWKLTNTFLNHASLSIAPSAHLREKLVEHGIKTPCIVLPNGVDVSAYCKKDLIIDSSLPKKARGEKWIINVGRMSGEKRQRHLVGAMRHIQNEKAKLVLVGDGPELENLKEYAEELGVEQKVLFLGRQSRDAVAALLNQADIFAQSSYRFDNQPMVILEAIASCLPIVYCDDNLREGMTEDNAILTESTEAEGFAQAFNTLLEDPARLKKMSTASRKLSKEFDIFVLAKKLEEIYSSARPLYED